MKIQMHAASPTAFIFKTHALKKKTPVLLSHNMHNLFILDLNFSFISTYFTSSTI